MQNNYDKTKCPHKVGGLFVLHAKTINDGWHQILWHILETVGEGDDMRFVHTYPTGIIQRGSYAGDQARLQFPGFAMFIEFPLIDNIVTMPEGSGIPVPTDAEQAQKYFERYILGTEVAENETYTYGARLNISLWDIIEDMKTKPISNQYCMEVGRPEDYKECISPMGTPDPPCLRIASLKCRPAFKKVDGKDEIDRENSQLDMTVFFRSWDIFGMPENLAGLSMLLKFIADEVGIPVGNMFCYSDGLHLYRYSREIAEMRTRMKCPEF